LSFSTNMLRIIDKNLAVPIWTAESDESPSHLFFFPHVPTVEEVQKELQSCLKVSPISIQQQSRSLPLKSRVKLQGGPLFYNIGTNHRILTFQASNPSSFSKFSVSFPSSVNLKTVQSFLANSRFNCRPEEIIFSDDDSPLKQLGRQSHLVVSFRNKDSTSISMSFLYHFFPGKLPFSFFLMFPGNATVSDAVGRLARIMKVADSKLVNILSCGQILDLSLSLRDFLNQKLYVQLDDSLSYLKIDGKMETYDIRKGNPYDSFLQKDQSLECRFNGCLIPPKELTTVRGTIFNPISVQARKSYTLKIDNLNEKVNLPLNATVADVISCIEESKCVAVREIVKINSGTSKFFKSELKLTDLISQVDLNSLHVVLEPSISLIIAIGNSTFMLAVRYTDSEYDVKRRILERGYFRGFSIDDLQLVTDKGEFRMSQAVDFMAVYCFLVGFRHKCQIEFPDGHKEDYWADPTETSLQLQSHFSHCIHSFRWRFLKLNKYLNDDDLMALVFLRSPNPILKICSFQELIKLKVNDRDFHLLVPPDANVAWLKSNLIKRFDFQSKFFDVFYEDELLNDSSPLIRSDDQKSFGIKGCGVVKLRLVACLEGMCRPETEETIDLDLDASVSDFLTKFGSSEDFEVIQDDRLIFQDHNRLIRED